MGTDDADGPDERSEENVGRQLRGNLSTFASVTADFYRGEVERTASWRARLDQTTNWAVVIVAAVLTWAFSSSDNPHYVILIGVFGVLAFLFMEANRYREYDVWRDRVRTVQSELLAEMYDPTDLTATDRTAADSPPKHLADWQAWLGEDLRNPTFNTTYGEAISHRLRRSYLALLLILLAAWIARITVFAAGEGWRQTASITTVPGEVVVAAVATLYLGLIAVTVWSARGSRVREFQE